MRKFQFPAVLFSLVILLIGTFFFAPHALAACKPGTASLDLGDCLTLSDGKTVKSVYAAPADLVNVIVRNIFIVAGLILFGLIIYSGFLFISGGEKGITQAKEILTTALIGFLVMFMAYWIVRIISIVTGANILF